MNKNFIPTGFEILDRSSPVTKHWEPIYIRTEGESLSLGFWIDDKHCNSRGFLHGGVIASLADIAMGRGYAQALKERRGSIVTSSMSIDYASKANKGQWLEIRTRVIRATSGTGFVDCIVNSESQIIVRASAVFRNLQKSY